MTKPSEKSLSVAEELLDYVHHGMTRAAALQEVAKLVDEMNSELVDAVEALLAEEQRNATGSHAVLLAHLKHVLSDYKPWHVESGDQHELFSTNTLTATRLESVPGQMP